VTQRKDYLLSGTRKEKHKYNVVKQLTEYIEINLERLPLSTDNLTKWRKAVHSAANHGGEDS